MIHNKCHDLYCWYNYREITEILLKVALSTIKQNKSKTSTRASIYYSPSRPKPGKRLGFTNIKLSGTNFVLKYFPIRRLHLFDTVFWFIVFFNARTKPVVESFSSHTIFSLVSSLPRTTSLKVESGWLCFVTYKTFLIIIGFKWVPRVWIMLQSVWNGRWWPVVNSGTKAWYCEIYHIN
jgi:hypothetical protein